MTSLTVALKMDFGGHILDEASRFITDEADRYILDQSFFDVNADGDLLNTVPLSYRKGVMSNELPDRVGDVGTAVFGLNNSNRNSAGLAGYYSPEHGNVRAGFGLDTIIQIELTGAATTILDFRGRVSIIDPEPGQYLSRVTNVTAEDWFGYATDTPLRGITVQTSKRDDQLLTTLLALAPVQPDATDFDTGDDTYTYALHTENSDSQSLISVMQKITESGFGKLFVRGSTTSAETLTYINRTNTLLTSSPVATLDNSMTGLNITRNKRRRVKTVIVRTYPVQADSSDVVLWVSQQEIALTTGQSVEFDVFFRDPDGKAVRVAATSLLAAVAGTDFNFSSVSGSGSDLNSSLSVSYNLQADIATVTLTNNSGSTGYLLVGYQIRGKATYIYEPHSSVVQTGQTTGETMLIDMPYQDDVFVGDDIADLVATWYAVDQSYIDSVSFVGNTNDTLMGYALTVQPGDLIEITETQTGITSGTYFVQGIEKNIQSGIIRVTWVTIPANQISGVFILDVSALDVDILGA